MRIAIDAMGGDHAPREVVNGALAASTRVDAELILVGIPSRIQEFLPKSVPSNVHIHPAGEVVGMEEPAMDAVRQKKDSSLAVATRLVEDGECDAVVSAGNTAAACALALLRWKPIPGIHRPAIATQLPSSTGRFVLLDSGATVDCSAANLLDFAVMGSAYASLVMNVRRPRVGLLNIGEEPGKGNALSKKAYDLLSRHLDNFIGNVEGKHLFSGRVDVVVCDAFVGNIVLKTGEAVAEMIMSMIKDALPKHFLLRLPLPLLLGGLVELKRSLDYSEYGGAPLLGVNGVFVICHGRSDSRAICNAVLQAAAAVKRGLVKEIRSMVSAMKRETTHA